MTKLKIKLSDINAIREFVTLTNLCPYDIDLVSGRYVVDAKSLMGIFSLDLAKPINLEIFSDDCADFIAKIKPYIVEE
ncbi:MAG: HPr family phosphocarrier protein [Clostridia bacterium]|nr:HPr family phosphocarrier protein [Clostridia bacterium]